ncbi:polyribonucleotide nucleotidyltransferase [Candidatus Saccharibacteria bacterium]|nr:polyribonucleotide nucleotidyltransferase [Candidatus Saccharibacteria bacterium]MBJ58331.1 polyribonucleotide nucleotidyltransferase [Candidatus Saccharibacteria bacterium]MBQ69502.1 polyribonucleotide nucleotidyltransferase [Candidatus Saccharibacteria bacterium]|tara:strand:- start:7788 stop:9905 length:2118 start_codon:yes stop_codon:yes gene_type:complete
MATINPYGKEIISVSTEFEGRPLTLEVNRVGFRSTGSVLVRYGDTVVLGTAQVGSRPVVLDYFPLSIDYEEKFYAAGKISGSRFIKREGRPSDEAVLIGRLIDRPIRPLFPKGYRQEVQVVSSVLSMDPAFRPDMVAMIAASAALMLTGTPFDGPVAGLRIGRVNGEFKAFLSAEERDASDLDLVVAGIESGITMVEAGANEVPEEVIADALAWAFDHYQPAIALQRELAEKLQPAAQTYELVLPNAEIQEAVDGWVEGKFGEALRKPYPERNEMINQIRWAFHEEMAEKVGEDYPALRDEYDEAFTSAVHKDVRKGIVEDHIRPDGRAFDEIRPLSSEVGILPRTHGSALFTRGVTQALNIVTLAPLSYAQMVDTMEVNDGERRYMHHYNAPGYTVGEVRRLGSPGRREIGHGYLAERAIIPVLPTAEEFPYAMRSVTEIMSQNGSTSMAATCSSCLALMDAGVPIKRPVSGIAMGLIMEGETPHILSDIADAEDFAGDMDFKSAGTEKGITALQMDMKVHGLPVAILREALMTAQRGRAFILDHMLTTMAAPRVSLSPYAPRIEKIKINPDKIGAVIGKGGEVINKITAETGAEIDIKEDGLITVASPDGVSIEKALNWIKSLTEEPEVGRIYEGTVVSIKDFGAFVNILPGIDGMVHISQLSDKRVEKVEDVLHEGQVVKVKLTGIDERGRLSLSLKEAQAV